MENFAAIDFETANASRSSICSIGIVTVKNNRISDKFYSLVMPTPAYFSFSTIKIHGITFADVMDAPKFPQAWEEAQKVIGNLPLVAHNKAFDENCLKEAFKAYNMPYPNYEFHCTLISARKKLQNVIPNFRLNTVAKHFGFDLTNHHHALADAEACAVIAKELI